MLGRCNRISSNRCDTRNDLSSGGCRHPNMVAAYSVQTVGILRVKCRLHEANTLNVRFANFVGAVSADALSRAVNQSINVVQMK
jgi:hypothetical protein